MAQITETHIDFLNNLIAKKTEKKKYDDSQILLDVLKYIAISTKENVVQTPKEVAIEITQEEPSTQEESEQIEILSVGKETPQEIIAKVATAVFNEDLPEFINKLTSAEIKNILDYAKNNPDTVREIIQKSNYPAIIQDEDIEIVLSVIECVPFILCVRDDLAETIIMAVSYHPSLLKDTTFEKTKFIFDKNRLTKFDTKTKKLDCDGLNCVLDDVNDCNGLTQVIYTVNT